MQLPTISGDDLDYGDRPSDPTYLVEMHSAAASYPFDVLELEVSALCTASLLLQIRTGRRVAKVLNMTSVVASLIDRRVDGGEADLSSVVNYLGRLVLDERFFPTTVTAAVIERLDGSLADELRPILDELGRIERFVRAVGLDDHTSALAQPSIHVALDREVLGEHAGGRPVLDWLADQSPYLAAQALWWDASTGERGDRLTAPYDERWSMLDGEPVLFVPTRFLRTDEIPSRGASTARLVELVAAAPRTIGVSVTTPAPAHQSDYESELCAAVVQHSLDLSADAPMAAAAGGLG